MLGTCPDYCTDILMLPSGCSLLVSICSLLTWDGHRDRVWFWNFDELAIAVTLSRALVGPSHLSGSQVVLSVSGDHVAFDVSS